MRIQKDLKPGLCVSQGSTRGTLRGVNVDVKRKVDVVRAALATYLGAARNH
jgi:hypothetical protein